MNGDSYDNIVQTEAESYDGSEDYEGEQVDEVLDSLIESAGGDFSERRGGRGRRGRTPPRKVPTGTGQSAYRTPSDEGAPVNQKQLKEALNRVGMDVRRNAEGIKTVNTRLNTITGRVDGVVSLAEAHTRKMVRLDKQIKLDAAFEFVEALTPDNRVNIYQLLKGAVKSGLFGDGTGAFGNPLVVGGLGLLLNRPDILGGLVQTSTAGR